MLFLRSKRLREALKNVVLTTSLDPLKNGTPPRLFGGKIKPREEVNAISRLIRAQAT
jgi:hypothetical protein